MNFKPIILQALVLSSALCQDKKPLAVSVQATVVDTFKRTLSDGNVVTNEVRGVYWRDSAGRTRMERGSLVIIQDPAARKIATLDLQQKTAHRSTEQAAGQPATMPSMSQAMGGGPSQDLGTRTIEGMEARGSKITVVVPAGAIGNLHPIQQVSEVWLANGLALPLLLKTTDALNGEHVQSLHSIVTGLETDPGLFQIPSDFKVIELGTAPQSGTLKLR